MPQYNHDLVGACQAIQREATAMAGMNAPFNLGLKNGALDFITSPDNTMGVDNIRMLQDGPKIKKLEFFYDQRTRPCQITNTLVNICNEDGTTPIRKRAEVTIDNANSTPPRYFSNDEMVVLCQGQQEFIQNRLRNDLRALRERLSATVLAELETFVGKAIRWDGTTVTDTGATSIPVNLLDNSSGQYIPLPGGLVEMQKDYERMQLSGIPAVIGDGFFDMFIRLNNLACCNSTTPYADAISNAGVAYFHDQQASNVLVTNHVLMLPFGITKLVTFNKNDNIGINNELEQHITVQDPAGYPIRYNLDFKWDCTVERWKYVYSIEWTIFNIFQNDSFGTAGEGESPDTSPDCSDELDGVLGVFKYHVV